MLEMMFLKGQENSKNEAVFNIQCFRKEHHHRENAKRADALILYETISPSYFFRTQSLRSSKYFASGLHIACFV